MIGLSDFFDNWARLVAPVAEKIITLHAQKNRSAAKAPHGSN